MGRRGGLVTAVVVAAGTAVSVGPLAAPATACSCVGFTDAQALARADAVFVGTLESRSAPSAPDGSAEHVFAVTEVRKGQVAPRQEVVSAASGASCGLELTGAGPHLVFARTTPYTGEAPPGRGQLVGGLCDGTRTLTEAELAAVPAADAAPVPIPRSPASEESDGGNGPVLLLAFATGAGVLGFLAILRRERHKRRPPAR